MKYFALFRYIYSAIISQKIIQLLFVVFSLILLLFILGVHIQAADGVIQSVRIYNSKPIPAVDVAGTFGVLGDIYVQFIFFTSVLICLIATANVMPDMLVKKTMQMILAKPFSRWAVLAGIYAGTVAAILSLQALFIVGMWSIFSLKTQSVSWVLLSTFPPMAIAFASMYSFVLLLAILFKSTGSVTSAALIYMMFITSMLANRETGFLSHVGIQPVKYLFSILYYLLPQIHDLQLCASKVIMMGIWDPTSMICSMGSAMGAYLLTGVLFRKLDL